MKEREREREKIPKNGKSIIVCYIHVKEYKLDEKYVLAN